MACAQQEGSQATQHHDDTHTRDSQAPVQRHTALCVEILEVATSSNLGDAEVETVDTYQLIAFRLAIAGDLALKLAGHGYHRYQPLTTQASYSCSLPEKCASYVWFLMFVPDLCKLHMCFLKSLILARAAFGLTEGSWTLFGSQKGLRRSNGFNLHPCT